MWTWACIALSLTFSIFATGCAVCAVHESRKNLQLPRRALTEIDARTRSLEAQSSETAETLTVLANRVKMQRVRTAANHIGDPALANDKDELRRRAGLVAGKPARHQ